MAHPDLAAEQAYLDNAYLSLERMRATVERASSAVDGEVAALALEAWARRRLATFSDAEQGLCFGRLDLDEQRAVSELLDGIEVTREDPPAAAARKADPRLAEAIRAAVDAMVEPKPEELVLYVDGAYVRVRVREREVAELLAAVEPPYAPAKAFLQKYLDRVLHLPKPEAVVRKVLAQEKLGARGGWSVHDLPLLDEARALLDGPPPGYGHVIVDEAQDLTPLQLRASLAGPAPSGHVFDETELPVLTAPQAKGLEFDHVVVVEPALIVEEGGLRELYVALTRPTKTLVGVHENPLPEGL